MKTVLFRVNSGLFAFVGCACLNALAFAEPAHVEIVSHGKGKWELRVDGKPTIVKGVVYNFATVGDDPDKGTLRDWSIMDLDLNHKIDVAYDSWVDANLNNKQDMDEPRVGDWQLLADMGANAIRVYQMPSDDWRLMGLYGAVGARLTFFHKPNKEIFRDLYDRYGIRVIIGHFFGEWTIGSGASWEKGTDYTDPVQRRNLLECIRVMAEEHRDEPYTLMWLIGNENFNPNDHDNAETQVKAFLTLVNEAAVLLHQLDPHHPVALCNLMLAHLREIALYCPDVDILGMNNYMKGFAPLWARVRDTWDRPVLLTEYGATALPFKTVDETSQADYHRISWQDIEQNTYGGAGTGNSIGGTVFEWCDMWNLGGSPLSHDKTSSLGVMGIEWFGLTSQGDGSDSPFMRQLRQSYFVYRKLWKASVHA